MNVLGAMSSSGSFGNKKSIYYKELFVLDSLISVNLLRKSKCKLSKKEIKVFKAFNQEIYKQHEDVALPTFVKPRGLFVMYLFLGRGVLLHPRILCEKIHD